MFTKTIIGFCIGFLSLPVLVYAAWWNPSSWFKKERNVEPQAEVTQPATEQETGAQKERLAPAAVSLVAPSLELLNARKEIESKNTEILSLKKALAELQKSLTEANPRCEQVIIEKQVEKVVYQEKMVEKPVEKIIYKDRIVEKEVEKPVEKVVYRDRVVEKPVEKIVYQDRIVEKPIYQERIVEKPIEKIVYQDRIVPGACSTPTPPVPEYSDYNFNYEWQYETLDPTMRTPSNVNPGAALLCPATSRSIWLRKASFKIPDEDVQKLNQMENKKDANHQYVFSAKLNVAYDLSNGRRTSQMFDLERKDAGTLTFFGGTSSICSNNGVVSVSISAAVYPVGSASSSEQPEYFYPSIIPQMPEWDVWDATSNKPVKIR